MEVFNKLGALILVFIIVGAIIAFPLMWLWNGCLVGAVAGVSEITALQAFGLYILSGMLFKNASVEKK